MKKAKVISTPTRVSELSLDDMYDDDSQIQLRFDRLNARKLHAFRRELKTIG